MFNQLELPIYKDYRFVSIAFTLLITLRRFGESTRAQIQELFSLNSVDEYQVLKLSIDLDTLYIERGRISLKKTTQKIVCCVKSKQLMNIACNLRIRKCYIITLLITEIMYDGNNWAYSIKRQNKIKQEYRHLDNQFNQLSSYKNIENRFQIYINRTGLRQLIIQSSFITIPYVNIIFNSEIILI